MRKGLEGAEDRDPQLAFAIVKTALGRCSQWWEWEDREGSQGLTPIRNQPLPLWFRGWRGSLGKACQGGQCCRSRNR